MNTLDSIRSMHAASKVRLDACRATHATIVDHVNALLMSGQVEGVPFKIGEQAEITRQYDRRRGRMFLVENIYIKLVTFTGRYTVFATGRLIKKKDGRPGEERASAEIAID